MLARLVLLSPGRPGEHPGVPTCALARLAREFPATALRLPAHAAEVSADLWVDAQAWDTPHFDLYAFDARIDALAADGHFMIAVVGHATRLAQAAMEILTRCQRLSPRRNGASRGALFDRVLARHRALHDLGKPLVRADYDHALDTWQWVLRLSADASIALQAAALFHDVERLVSEADARVEHAAADYQSFKDAHAASGARIARAALREAGMTPGEIARAAELIAAHERPSGDQELDLLNDADALSFFSLNSGGFMDYYGPEHTRRKIDYTLSRLRPAARRRLAGVRLRDDVNLLVARALAARAGEAR